MTGYEADRITLARFPSGVPIETTVHTYDGAADGPTLYVQAAQHGREINGTDVLRHFHDVVDPADLAGTVVAVPVADPLTFDRVSYTTPEVVDSVNPNMNRCWPGDPDGTLHERMASTLWEYALDADAVVDLHTGGREMLTHVVFREGDPEARRMADAFGTGLLLSEPAGEDADDEWHDRDFGGKFRVAAGGADLPAITPELAHNKELVEGAIETGLTGLMNVCRELGLLDGAVVDNPSPRGPDEALLARNHLGRVTAAHSGLFRIEADLAVGDRVDAGDPVGTVYDPATYEPLQTVETDRAGLLYSLTREATVRGGDTLLSVALPRED